MTRDLAFPEYYGLPENIQRWEHENYGATYIGHYDQELAYEDTPLDWGDTLPHDGPPPDPSERYQYEADGKLYCQDVNYDYDGPYDVSWAVTFGPTTDELDLCYCGAPISYRYSPYCSSECEDRDIPF
jgi:hypothetical protein